LPGPELMVLVRSKLTSVRLALRARIVLLAAKGMLNKDIALQLWAVCKFRAGANAIRYCACRASNATCRAVRRR
jgi:hypothetical protein